VSFPKMTDHYNLSKSQRGSTAVSTPGISSHMADSDVPSGLGHIEFYPDASEAATNSEAAKG
jgi:hypothetical protein